MKKSPLFAELRAKLTKEGYEHEYFCGLVGISRATLSLRLNGHRPWQLDEMYAVMKVLRIPHSQMHVYFPDGGKTPVERTLKVSFTPTRDGVTVQPLRVLGKVN